LINQLIEINGKLMSNLEVAIQEIEKQSTQIEALQSRIAELEVQLNQNSQNSSKPPSSDLVKPKRRVGIKQRKKKLGGQKGHQGKTLEMVDQANEYVPCRPVRCACGKRLLRQQMRLHQRRQEFDIPDPALVVTEYQQYSCDCPACGKQNIGQFPAHITGPVQYGSGVRTLVTILNIKCQLSYENIECLFEDLFGQPINSSTIQTILERADKAGLPIVDQIKEALLMCAVIHGDETGMNIEQKKEWLHGFSNESWTYLFAHDSRGRKAIEDYLPELYTYRGTLVHDCWSSYWSITTARHSLCLPHILRELTALIEQGSKWASKMYSLLMRLYSKYEEDEQIDKKSYEWKRYQQICRLAIQEEPEPIKRSRGRSKKTKGRNLADRLKKYSEEVLRFAMEVGIPFSNNQAERDLRPSKGKLKVAGCFRSWNGAQRYARLQSIFSTWKKQGYSIFQELKAILEGHTFQFQTKTT